jgi:hypothetical protein
MVVAVAAPWEVAREYPQFAEPVAVALGGSAPDLALVAAASLPD